MYEYFASSIMNSRCFFWRSSYFIFSSVCTYHLSQHFKGATKELYKRPSLSFSKDAIKHYAVPKEKRNKKSVTISTGQRSKSATVQRNKPHGSNMENGQEGGGGGHGPRPLTAPPAPGLHRPKVGIYVHYLKFLFIKLYTQID